ncbi:MAG: thioesterase family protein [Moraxellaceae bacterium]|nr:thioesterase family protein [Moraxellaceae bacterium]
MSFDKMMQSISPNSQQMTILPNWGQGRATYGGLIGAILLQHCQQTLNLQRPLRSLSVNFVGPAAAGNIDLDSQLLRTGKSASQAHCIARQNDQAVAAMLCAFADDRHSEINVPAQLAPDFAAPDTLQALPYLPGITPEFTQQFDFRWASGDLPFTGSASPNIGGWVRFREPPAVLTAAAIVALVDAWPPATASQFRQPAAISTMSWTLELVAALNELKASDWWQYQANTEFAQNGYAHIEAKLWSSSGQLIAISRQTVALFY